MNRNAAFRACHWGAACFWSLPPFLPRRRKSRLPCRSSPVSIGGVLQVLFGLAVVLATVAGAAWLLKRLAPGQISAGGAIKLIGGIAVGPKERVVVVEVGDTWLVVGVAPGQVTALHNMPRLDTFARGDKPASG